MPSDPGHQRGGKRLNDLNITLSRGTVQDFVWTWYSECLFQCQVLTLFRSEGFTGFDVKPIKARFKKGNHEPPTLWELVVRGWGGVADQNLASDDFCIVRDVNLRNTLASGNPQNLIDDKQWDGSDFFIVWPMPRLVFVTERVANCIRDHQLTGVLLRDVRGLTDVGKDGLSGGRLSDWMPESRARELGERPGSRRYDCARVATDGTGAEANRSCRHDGSGIRGLPRIAWCFSLRGARHALNALQSEMEHA